jgi:hypothetical protein
MEFKETYATWEPHGNYLTARNKNPPQEIIYVEDTVS